MINKLRNIYRTSRLRYFTQAAVIGGAIYTMIQLMPSGYELKEIDKFATVQQVTTEKGLFINDYRIPLELMKPDQEIELPYSQIKSPEGGLDLMVDDSLSRRRCNVSESSLRSLSKRATSQAPITTASPF